MKSIRFKNGFSVIMVAIYISVLIGVMGITYGLYKNYAFEYISREVDEENLELLAYECALRQSVIFLNSLSTSSQFKITPPISYKYRPHNSYSLFSKKPYCEVINEQSDMQGTNFQIKTYLGFNNILTEFHLSLLNKEIDHYKSYKNN